MKALIVAMLLLVAVVAGAEEQYDNYFTIADGEQGIQLNIPNPPTRISFGTTPESYIDWSSGSLAFHGNADKSAEIFFKYYIKGLVDEYLREKLRSNFSPKNRSY